MHFGTKAGQRPPAGVAGRALRRRRGSSSVRTSRNGGRKRLLVVEDNFDMAELVCDFLADHGMESVGPAATVEQALMLVADNQLDAGLLDIKLHKESNVFPVCDLLAARLVPFGFVTGWGPVEVPGTFKGAPMILKPFKRAEILRLVKALLKEP